MDQRIINLYDEYTHKPLTRKAFMQQLVMLTGSTAAAMSLLPMLESDYNTANITTEGELFTEYITYPGVQGEMKAYVARPEKKKKYPAVLVIHENRGLNAHIEDVARRAANAGYLAIAPNALAPLTKPGMTEDEARQLFSTLKAEDNTANFMSCIDYLPAREDWNGKFGCVGFCWGGAMANTLAVKVPALGAAVAFYGRQPDAKDVPNIKAAVQLHYGSLDERVNAGMAAYEEALKANKITYEQYVYEGVNHAFHNDTSEARYNAESAKLAWDRTIAFFKKHIG
ncbi:dienelactone hydrolase family protein [Haliscomenobacter hydrossis]|uniref:Carboxymethylenebutenolidase n=1 Tax=Haliscomenobacter hydrossis (strain ATCC 27775 / DSM 1100 / LMG 10767 / O) TaxID=760192 RepID=F4KRD6_HALH1|nr:dienelactone hydrolase family protein [Haliscomenobacter hydrossis]AEE47926.1 Carboxymethylenebutenolidase [Haliscomenobacter hydrossis DSM 1100]